MCCVAFEQQNVCLGSKHVRTLIPFETIKYGDKSERESFDIYGNNLPKGNVEHGVARTVFIK